MHPEKLLQQEVAEQYRPGMSAEKLAKAAGCHLWVAHCAMADIAREQALLAGHQRGRSMAAMAEEYQVSIPTIWRTLNQAVARGQRQQKKVA